MISKIYFAIVSLFILMSLLLFVGFVTLQNGLFLPEISVSNIHIKQLYIKWNEKLDISIEEIAVIPTSVKTEDKLNYRDLGEILKKLSQTSHWFNSLVIEKILYKEFEGTFKYHNSDRGFLVAFSKESQLKLTINHEDEILCIDIQRFYDKTKNIDVKGKLYIDTKDIKFYTNLNLSIAKELDLTLFSKADTTTLNYKIISNKVITDYKHTISLVNLPKEARYWAYDAIKMSSLKITNICGHIEYNKLNEALKNIHISAIVNKLQYTYNKDLDAIHTQWTALEFKDGILYIYPHNAISYNKDLGKSWLQIDFTKKEELLTLHLLFDSLLDKDMLTILNTYRIKLPFLQKKGKVSTDLTITVSLRNINVDVHGTFYTKEANFDYLGLNIDIYNATITLNNYDVNIKSMGAKYKDVAKAMVDLTYNAATSEGKIDFHFNDISLKYISLNAKSTPLHATYNIKKDLDFIEIDKSVWNTKIQKVNVDAIRIPFNLQKLTLEVPTSFIELKGIGTAFISGFINLKDEKAQFNADVLKLSYEGIELSQSNTPLLISYDKQLSIRSKNEIFFNIAGSNYKINDLFMKIDENKISLKHTKIDIGKYIQTKIYANYNYKTNKSHISLSNFTLTDPNTNKTIYKNKKIMLSASNKDNTLTISSKELDSVFTSKESGWKLKINSIGRVAKNSTLLKKYYLTQGDFTLYKKKNDKFTRFKAHISYPYKLLVKNNKPEQFYKIKGKIYKEKVYVNVNNKIHASIKDTVHINMDNTSVNITELIRAVKDTSSESNSTNLFNVFLNAKNSSLYINPNRSILYDTLDIQYYDKILTAQLSYHNAKAGLKLEMEDFNLYGKDFNDNFMNHLFYLANFKGGKLDFALGGKLNDYTGVMYIKKTTITDYKILNNILAFINTVPSLVTFQLPGYSNEGLSVNKAYINFKSKKSTFNLTDIYLDSKEIDILGHGIADFKNDNLDVILNLKTDLGSDLSKVPLVGYILLDGNSISTTLSIKGKTSDPQVKLLLAEEIVVAPLNIIKRTLTLPYKLIKDALDNNNSK